MDDLALAEQVASMSVQEYGKNRQRFGLGNSTLDFLAGL
jgi:hypothetical protein